MQTFQSLLTNKLSEGLRRAGFPAAGELTQATDPRFGDYQTNVALIVGKQRGENPRAVAEKIVTQLDVSDVSEPPVIAGAGFINFKLRPAAVENQTLDILRDERL
ncbi:MAG TPA: arginine--tRNA ligase, partial [Candidatus Udaeobacter sp.]